MQDPPGRAYQDAQTSATSVVVKWGIPSSPTKPPSTVQQAAFAHESAPAAHPGLNGGQAASLETCHMGHLAESWALRPANTRQITREGLPLRWLMCVKMLGEEGHMGWDPPILQGTSFRLLDGFGVRDQHIKEGQAGSDMCQSCWLRPLLSLEQPWGRRIGGLEGE